MGGLGSGYWDRWDTKDTVEQCHRIDIRYLKQQGLLKPGYSGWLRWSRGGVYQLSLDRAFLFILRRNLPNFN